MRSREAQRRQLKSQHVKSAIDMVFTIKISLCMYRCPPLLLYGGASDYQALCTNLPVLRDQVLTVVMGWARAYHGYAFEDPSDGSWFGPKTYV